MNNHDSCFCLCHQSGALGCGYCKDFHGTPAEEVTDEDLKSHSGRVYPSGVMPKLILPEKKKTCGCEESELGYHSKECTLYEYGWNDCLEEVIRLNKGIALEDWGCRCICHEDGGMCKDCKISHGRN